MVPNKSLTGQLKDYFYIPPSFVTSHAAAIAEYPFSVNPIAAYLLFSACISEITILAPSLLQTS